MRYSDVTLRYQGIIVATSLMLAVSLLAQSSIGCNSSNTGQRYQLVYRTSGQFGMYHVQGHGITIKTSRDDGGPVGMPQEYLKLDIRWNKGTCDVKRSAVRIALAKAQAIAERCETKGKIVPAKGVWELQIPNSRDHAQFHYLSPPSLEGSSKLAFTILSSTGKLLLHHVWTLASGYAVLLSLRSYDLDGDHHPEIIVEFEEYRLYILEIYSCNPNLLRNG
jgi:hypothetical protein